MADVPDVTEDQEPISTDTPPETSTTIVSFIGPDGQQSTQSATLDLSVSQELIGQSRVEVDKIGVALNTSTTPSVKHTAQAVLPEFRINGMSDGEAFDLAAVNIGSETVEKTTAYDFLSMRHAAAKEGISLAIVEAYRSYERQVKLFNERMNPDGTPNAYGLKHGRAGRPGLGKGHSRGQALDLTVNMTVDQLAAGELSPAFRWLTDNAATYGFKRTVPTEPWHWEHLGGAIVGPPDDAVDYYLSLVQSSASGAASLQGGKPDFASFAAKQIHDTSKARERSVAMTRTSRQLLYANMGRTAVFHGASLLGKAARYEQRISTATGEVPAFKEDSLNSLSFDFTTGLWGDGGNV